MKQSVLLLIFLTMAIYSQAQYKPAFKEVVTEFFTRYSHESVETNIKFQKRKDGWYVVEDYYSQPGNYFNKQLFWSDNEAIFLKLSYPNASSDSGSIVERIDKYASIIDWPYEETQFAKHKYYGYIGWDWDIINEPVNLDLMTDTLWESFGRANSNYASGFIVEQFGDVFLNNDKDRQPLKPYQNITKSRSRKFIFYETKAIEAYQTILKHNPDYETRVGKIQIKCANEYMFMYLDLIMTGDSTAAKEFVVKADYPDSLIKLNRSYLASLPLNSILITGGDNDTYPLLYLQEVKKYRRDIIVLNYNLLGLRQYLLFVDKRYKKGLFSTVDSNYLKNSFDYFLYSNDSGKKPKISVDEFIKAINQNKNLFDTSVTTYKGETLRKYYSKQLFLSKKRSDIIAISKIITLDRYLLLNDFMVLDILNTNSKKRKVYFTFSPTILSELLVYKEPVYELNAFSD